MDLAAVSNDPIAFFRGHIIVCKWRYNPRAKFGQKTIVWQERPVDFFLKKFPKKVIDFSRIIMIILLTDERISSP